MSDGSSGIDTYRGNPLIQVVGALRLVLYAAIEATKAGSAYQYFRGEILSQELSVILLDRAYWMNFKSEGRCMILEGKENRSNHREYIH